LIRKIDIFANICENLLARAGNNCGKVQTATTQSNKMPSTILQQKTTTTIFIRKNGLKPERATAHQSCTLLTKKTQIKHKQ